MLQFCVKHKISDFDSFRDLFLLCVSDSDMIWLADIEQ